MVILVATTLASGCSQGDSDNKEPPAPAMQTTSPLDAALQRLTEEVRSNPFDEQAIAGLVGLREAAIPATRELAKSEDSDVREASVAIAQQIPSRAALDVLIGRLEDPDDDVRQNAVEALGDWRNADAAPALLEAFDREEDGSVKWEIVTSLGRIGDPSALPLFRAGVKDENPYMRMWSVAALCDMRAPDAIEWASKLIVDPNKYVRNQTATQCKEMLAQPAAGDAALDAALAAPQFGPFASLSRPAVLRANALQAARVQTIDRLAGELDAESPRNLWAAFLLAELGDRRGLPLMQSVQGSENPFFLHKAAIFMAEMPDPASVPVLVELIQSPSELVAASAYAALLTYAEDGDATAIEATQKYTGKVADITITQR